jgi:phage gp46-like protein
MVYDDPHSLYDRPAGSLMSLPLFLAFEGPPPSSPVVTTVGPAAPRTGAISSAVQLADIALTWSNTTSDADMSLIDDDLASDRGLITAMLLSLFTDRRAETDDVPPSGDPNDRRGWWADQFAEVEGDKIGSRLWLLDRAKLSNENKLRAREYVLEAWQWMLDDKVAASIPITVTRMDAPAGIMIAGELLRPGRDPVSFRFAHCWDHIEEDV